MFVLCFSSLPRPRENFFHPSMFFVFFLYQFYLCRLIFIRLTFYFFIFLFFGRKENDLFILLLVRLEIVMLYSLLVLIVSFSAKRDISRSFISVIKSESTLLVFMKNNRIFRFFFAIRKSMLKDSNIFLIVGLLNFLLG